MDKYPKLKYGAPTVPCAMWPSPHQINQLPIIIIIIITRSSSLLSPFFYLSFKFQYLMVLIFLYIEKTHPKKIITARATYKIEFIIYIYISMIHYVIYRVNIRLTSSFNYVQHVGGSYNLYFPFP